MVEQMRAEFGLAHGFARTVALRGPGLYDREGITGSLLFDTHFFGKHTDLLALFFSEEMSALDWRADFLRDEQLEDLIETSIEMEKMQAVDDEPEEIWARSELVNSAGGDAFEDAS
jgi:hypothetical protein